MIEIKHNIFMKLALKLAVKGRASVSPNPMVGCVIVKDNKVIAEGWHQQAGGPHAEIIALQQAADQAAGATAYVTLEPCCHHGKTPPCTEALIQAGITTIYVACLDPNPLVAGKGIASLKAAGIDVKLGLCAEEAHALNTIFFHYITHQRPFVIAKWAMSLDGKTSTHQNDSPLISCDASRQSSHLLRHAVDAIIVGAKTAAKDNPRLNVRHPALNPEQIRQPLRIVVSSSGELPLDLHLFSFESSSKTLVATTHHMPEKTHRALNKKNVDVLFLPEDECGQVDIVALLKELGKRQITSVLVEGGMTLHQRFFELQLVNQIHIYLAPVIIASLSKKIPVSSLQFTSLDKDIYITADIKENYYV